MTARQGHENAVYHGYQREPFQRVIAVESPAGEQIGVLQHVIRHSPSGMNWGYAGSGPLDTARSLIIDALGTGALCPVCQGTARVVFIADSGEPFDPLRHPWSRHGWPCTCAGGYSNVPYADFAGEFVAHWGEEWVMSRANILAWLARKARAQDDPGGPVQSGQH